MASLAVAGLVAGQIFLKHAMNMTHGERIPWPRFSIWFAAGIAGNALWFFLWLGLLQAHDLSLVFPFEALSAIFLTAAAAIFLKEKITLRLAIGVLLIVGGVLLVSAS
ncbi:MAG: EamA family transporter [Verrucomicrobiae bacterium]|nr:EamA family transporter [Verrucomicrobiae bacterium]